MTLELPQGWTATPPEQPVKFARSDESQTVRFTVKPAPSTAAGEYHVRAVVTSGGQTFDRGYQVIEYPHIRRQHIYDAADATLKVIDVQDAAEPDDRLRDGRRRSGAAGDRAARREGAR